MKIEDINLIEENIVEGILADFAKVAVKSDLVKKGLKAVGKGVVHGIEGAAKGATATIGVLATTHAIAGTANAATNNNIKKSAKRLKVDAVYRKQVQGEIDDYTKAIEQAKDKVKRNQEKLTKWKQEPQSAERDEKIKRMEHNLSVWNMQISHAIQVNDKVKKHLKDNSPKS